MDAAATWVNAPLLSLASSNPKAQFKRILEAETRNKTMAMRASYDWERFYTAAILESDHSKLASRIDAAQTAIESRLQELNADHGGTAEEAAGD